jgi:hypothetical protein
LRNVRASSPRRSQTACSDVVSFCSLLYLYTVAWTLNTHKNWLTVHWQ